MKKTIISLIVATAFCIAAPFKVTENGKPAADIVIGAKADATIRHAADELQLWVKEITGAELPVVQSPGNLPNHISLGTSQHVQLFYAKDFLTLAKNDGYSVRREGNRLYIFGSVSKGVLNGVYRLLQRNTDIIWVRPDPEIGTVFTANPSLALTDCDYMDVPLMLLRGWKIDYPVPTKDVMWAIRNCANWCSIPADLKLRAIRNEWGIPQELYYGHNIIQGYLHPSRYYKEHPDYYAMQNGTRPEPKVWPQPVGSQPCFSNPEVAEVIKGHVKISAERFPQDKWISICVEDNEICCECPRCKEPIKLPDGRVLKHGDPAFFSTKFFMMLNEVARFLKKNYPGHGISTYAYLFAEIAPAVPVEDNIRVICTAPYKNVKYPVYAPQNEYSMTRLQSWLDLGKANEVVLYDYHGLSNEYSRPVDVNTANDYRFSYEHGLRCAYSEIIQDDAKKIFHHNNYNTCSSIYDGNEVYFWVINQLLWNPYQDVNQLRKDALKRIFGAAADDVAEYLSLAEKAWNASPFESLYHTNPNITWYALVQCGLVEQCREALTRANKHNLLPKSRKHLERLTALFENNNIIKAYPKYLDFSKKQRENPALYNNIVKNPSFEEHGDVSGVKQTDTQKLGANSWNFWCRTRGKCGISDSGAEDGKSCAWFADTDNACILQDIILQPGTYFVRARFKTEDPLQSIATISVRFRSKDNKAWDDTNSFKFFSPRVVKGEWGVIEGFFLTTPYDVHVSFQLGTPQSTGKVFFDHVELYRME